MEQIDLLSEEGRRRIERTFQYAEVGRCVNGVAHDVNNFLGAIMAYTELIGLNDSLPIEARGMLEEIIGAAKRSSHLINCLTEIARKAQADIRIIDIAQLVERVILLRQYDAKIAQVRLEYGVDADMPVVRLNLPKAVQALLYLIGNALDAVRGAETRVVKIIGKNAGDFVEIAVWNSGPILSEENREGVFEPFATAKDEQHLGLGLSMARAYAREEGGDLVYDPEQGFVMRLPKKVTEA